MTSSRVPSSNVNYDDELAFENEFGVSELTSTKTKERSPG